MDDIRDRLKSLHEHVAQVESHTAAARQDEAALSECTFNGQPLPDGIYSEELDPQPVLVKLKGAMTRLKPLTLTANQPYLG